MSIFSLLIAFFLVLIPILNLSTTSEIIVLWITHDQEQSSRIFNKRMSFLNGHITSMEVI